MPYFLMCFFNFPGLKLPDISPFLRIDVKDSEILLLGSILHQTQATKTDIDAAVPEKNGS